MPVVYIALGSNLQHPLKQVQLAISTLSKFKDIMLLSVSPFYRSVPLGPANQPDFLNAVIKIKTSLFPKSLLEILQKIELGQGRQRQKERFGPRTLDLDILLYDDLILNSSQLTIPHYDLKNREFVLYPLFDIEPNLLFPDGESLANRLKKTPKNGMTYWNE